MTDAQKFAIAAQKYMKEYLKLPKEEQVAIARKQLIAEGVIDENGEFTDNYAYSREYYKNKKNKKNSKAAV